MVSISEVQFAGLVDRDKVGQNVFICQVVSLEKKICSKFSLSTKSPVDKMYWLQLRYFESNK